MLFRSRTLVLNHFLPSISIPTLTHLAITGWGNMHFSLGDLLKFVSDCPRLRMLCLKGTGGWNLRSSGDDWKGEVVNLQSLERLVLHPDLNLDEFNETQLAGHSAGTSQYPLRASLSLTISENHPIYRYLWTSPD